MEKKKSEQKVAKNSSEVFGSSQHGRVRMAIQHSDRLSKLRPIVKISAGYFPLLALFLEVNG